MLNISVLIGRLTADPTLRFTPNGVATCSFTLAVDNPFKRDDASFIPIVVWQKSAENAATYLKKGSECAVEGRIATRNYENAEGRKIYVTEVVANRVQFLGSRQNGQREESQSADPFAGQGQPLDITDDDLPF